MNLQPGDGDGLHDGGYIPRVDADLSGDTSTSAEEN